MKHRSKAEKRKLRKARSIRSAIAHYAEKAKKEKNKESQRNGNGTSNRKRYVDENIIFAEDIFKLKEMSGGGIHSHLLYILNSARIHTVGELVLRMREGNLNVKGIGPVTKKEIQGTLKEYGISVPV